MPVNDDLADDAIMRSIRSMRATNALWAELLPILRRAERDLLAKLEDGAPRTVSSRRAQALLNEIRKVISGGADELHRRLEEAGKIIAEAEEAAAVKSLNARVPVDVDWVRPSARLLEAVATVAPFEGAILRDHLDKWTADTIFAMQAEIRTGIVIGEGIEPMQRRLRRVADIKIREARTIARTYTSHVTNEARASLYAQNADIILKEQWVATLDDRTCIRCAALDGETFSLGKGVKPPLHMNCLPGNSLVTPCGDISLVSKRWFEGDLVVIRTSAGRELTITPNHLIATRRGWVAAKRLNPGDQVICNSGSERARAGYDLRDNREARIEDVAEAFFSASGVVAAEVPVSAPDFHGDGAKSKVAIIGTNGGLAAKSDASSLGHIRKFLLNPRGVVHGAFARFCAFASFLKTNFASKHGLMGRFGERLNLFGRRAVHASLLLLAGVPQRDVVLAQNEFYLGAYHPEPICDSCRADAGRVKSKDFWKPATRFFKGVYFRERTAPKDDAFFFEDGADGLPVNAETFCDRLNRQSGMVEFDDVVAVNLKKGFAGHVYNLETTKNVYLAENIVIHNCRCVRIPITRAAEALQRRGLIGERAARDAEGMTGKVPADMRFPQWLSRQSEARQKEVLGKTRYEMFKNGTTFDKFVNDENEIIPLRDL